MAFLVQNDQGSIVDANSYTSEAFFTAYHTDRNVTKVIDGDFEPVAIQAALIKATDYVDGRYSFVGTKQYANQATKWPRFDAEDSDDNLIFGIPAQVKEATAELALAELNSPGSLFPSVSQDATGQGVKSVRQKLDVLELETVYFGENAASAQKLPQFYSADWRLKRSGLLVSSRRVALGG